MKIVLFGATGMVGSRVLGEALGRGHDVTAVARHTEGITTQHPHLVVRAGDVLNPASVAELALGHEVAISAVGPGKGEAADVVVQAAHALVEALRQLATVRLVVVGGAGSLQVAPGVQLLDTPEFPAAWMGFALAHREALAIYRASDLNWTYLSPAALLEPGERTGHYRTGTERLVTDEQGNSRISVEDLAVALLDEVEQPRFPQHRFTVAY